MGRKEKNCKFRFTSLVGVNAIGQMAFKPIYILKNCHRGIEWNKMKLSKLENDIQVYDNSKALIYIQPNAWMNAIIWSDFMARYDSFLKNKNQKVLCIADNFAGHKIDAEFNNIKLIFLRPNLTSVLQSGIYGPLLLNIWAVVQVGPRFSIFPWSVSGPSVLVCGSLFTAVRS